MSHLTVKEEVVREDQNGQKRTKEMEEAGSSNTKETPTKKVTAGGSAKKEKDKCVETCQPGPRSGCTIRGRGKPDGNLSCAEVDRRLEALGVSADKASRCVKAAIMKGFIKITGKDKKELKQVVHSEKWQCGHILKATLKDLIEQSDYAGISNEENAPVLCKSKKCAEEEGSFEGRAYVTGICEGKPSFDYGKSHNHCWKCPGFGQCIGDYREVHCDGCGKHYFGGFYEAYYCSCKKGREEKKEFGNGSTAESD
jgi:hypothetical protein